LCPRPPLPVCPSSSAGAVECGPPALVGALAGSEGATAVFFDGTQSTEVERNGHREAATVAPADLAALPEHLRRLAAKGVPRPEPDAPVIDATLADGTRITALFPPSVTVCTPVSDGRMSAARPWKSWWPKEPFA